MEKNNNYMQTDNNLIQISDGGIVGKPIGIGDNAPKFSAQTTFGMINLDDYRGKWLIFFSHPGGFTPVGTLLLNLLVKSTVYPH